MVPESYLKDCLCRLHSSDESAVSISSYDGVSVRDISSRQFVDDILSASAFFRAEGISGRHIAILAPESYTWCVVFFAILATGNIAVPMNSDLSAGILRTQCEKTDTDLILSTPAVEARLRESLSACPWLGIDEVSADTPMNLSDIHEAAPDDTYVLLCTSGTTGESKVVELSMSNFYYELRAVSHTVSPEDRMFFVLPPYHIGGLMSIFPLLIGCTKCIGSAPTSFFADLPVLNPTFVMVVPSFFETLCKMIRNSSAEAVQRYLGSELKTLVCVGAKLREDLIADFEHYSILLRMGYGATEVTSDAISGFVDKEHISAVGKPAPGVEVRIGDEGELLIKGPTVMKGYYKDPEETARVIIDGWFHTGDLARCDADGYYYITGRKKNVIILSNGENVNPEEIEALFGTCPVIEECLVYSDGKGICADVYTADKDAAEAFIRSYNHDSPSYRHVYKVNYCSEPLEKTGSGKIKRRENLL